MLLNDEFDLALNTDEALFTVVELPSETIAQVMNWTSRSSRGIRSLLRLDEE